MEYRSKSRLAPPSGGGEFLGKPTAAGPFQRIGARELGSLGPWGLGGLVSLGACESEGPGGQEPGSPGGWGAWEPLGLEAGQAWGPGEPRGEHIDAKEALGGSLKLPGRSWRLLEASRDPTPGAGWLAWGGQRLRAHAWRKVKR